MSTAAGRSAHVARYDVVVPTVGRASLAVLLTSLDQAGAPGPERVVVVDDRRGAQPALALPTLERLAPVVVRSGGCGPAAARNAGWRRCASPWVVFLDDDVALPRGWAAALAADLLEVGGPMRRCSVAAVAARVRVPQPGDRRLTDAERNVAALAEGRYITADLAVRRTALTALGGFDERFPRAYREDTDFALRLLDAGWRIEYGRRRTDHPLRGHGTWATSVRAQRGNADDALMRRLHGPDWRVRGHAPAGARRQHVATTGALAAAITATAARRPLLASVAGSAWAYRTARLTWTRARRGPAWPSEWARMLVSTVVLPLAASWWSVVGWWKARRLAPGGTSDRWSARVPELVLFDRDGTLVHDVPYNSDPDRVAVVDGARDALDRLRTCGVRLGIVTNQSGIGRGLLTRAAADAVTARVVELLGPFATVQTCEHSPDDGCECRKPAPGMVLAAARQVGVAPHECAVVGDIGADVDAALAAGARAILVPTAVTRVEEIEAAPEIASDLATAVAMLLCPGITGDMAPMQDVPAAAAPEVAAV